MPGNIHTYDNYNNFISRSIDAVLFGLLVVVAFKAFIPVHHYKYGPDRNVYMCKWYFQVLQNVWKLKLIFRGGGGTKVTMLFSKRRLFYLYPMRNRRE